MTLTLNNIYVSLLFPCLYKCNYLMCTGESKTHFYNITHSLVSSKCKFITFSFPVLLASFLLVNKYFINNLHVTSNMQPVNH